MSKWSRRPGAWFRVMQPYFDGGKIQILWSLHSILLYNFYHILFYYITAVQDFSNHGTEPEVRGKGGVGLRPVRSGC